MNPRFAATMEMQRPHRDPASLVGRDVCPHCKRPTMAYRFTTPDGVPVETHHCTEHGDVRPMRSHVINEVLFHG